jgi:hypothetical protein
MKNILAKINIKKLFSFKKINPHNHWGKLLYVFMFMIIFLILFSFYLLYEIKNQQIFQTDKKIDDQPVLMNENLLKEVDEYFDLKTQKTKEIKDGLKSYKDPSI